MQGEIYLWNRFLVLNSAAGDLEVIHMCIGVHVVELSQDQGVRIVGWTRLGQRWGWLNATANGA